MFWASPVGRLVSLLFTIGLLVVLWFTVGQNILDEVKDSTEAAGGGGPREERVVSEQVFGPMVEALKKKVGDDADMLSVTLRPTNTEFIVRDGSGAIGYRSEDNSPELEQTDVNLVGGGSVAKSAWPISKLDPAAPQRIADEISEKEGGDFTLSIGTLERQPSGKLLWDMKGRIDERGVAYTANANGAKVKVFDPTSPEISGIPSDPKAYIPENVQKLQDCLKKAGTDVDAVQRCTRRYGGG